MRNDVNPSRRSRRRMAIGLATALTLAAVPRPSDAVTLGDPLQVSFMGGDSTSFVGIDPSVAYNPYLQEYMVVWAGTHDTDGQVAGEYEIFAQRVSAETGRRVGVLRRVSEMGGLGDAAFGAHEPKVIFNLSTQEYFVVWWGTQYATIGPEIYARRLDRFGANLGNRIRVSYSGGAYDKERVALDPDVTYSPVAEEYFVVWRGEDDTSGMVDGEFEIFAHRVAYDGTPVGYDMRLSAVGGLGHAGDDAWPPSITYDKSKDRYLVAWIGQVQGVTSLYRAILYTSGGAAKSFLPSDCGTCRSVDVAYDWNENEYVMVLDASGDGVELVEGLRLDSNGVDTGHYVLISGDVGEDSPSSSQGASVVYDGAKKTALVSFESYPRDRPEAWIREYPPSDRPLPPSHQVSRTEGPGGDDGGVATVAVVPGPSGQALVVWEAGEDAPSGTEILSQRVRVGGFLFADGFETGSLGRWTSTTP